MPKDKVKKFRRVAVEGLTTDGREITAQQIQEMAETYDPKVYGARIWPEHFRGFFPGGAGDALGDITELKAETIKDGSELDGKMGLFVTGVALPKLKELNKLKQKVYSSIEMFTKLPATGKAYFAGIAATDSPASLGTEILAFGAGQGVIASDPIEADLNFEEVENDETPTLFSRVKGLLGKKDKTDTKRFNDIDSSVLEIAESQQNIIDFSNQQQTKFAAIEEKLGQLETDYNVLKTEYDSMVTKLSQDPNNNQRPDATGGDGQSQTDC